MLFYRSPRAKESVLRQLETFANAQDWTAASSSVRFAVARSLLRKSEVVSSASDRRKLRRRAAAHLRYVIDHEKTGQYRRSVAQRLLESES